MVAAAPPPEPAFRILHKKVKRDKYEDAYWMAEYKPSVARKLGRKASCYSCDHLGCKVAENRARLHLHANEYINLKACEEESEETKTLRLSVFQRYLHLGFHPGKHFYKRMLFAAARENNWAAMGEAFIVLQQDGNTPDDVLDLVVVKCEHSYEWELTARLFKKFLLSPGKKPSLASRRAAARVSSKLGEWYFCIVLIWDMEETGTAPDLTLYDAALTACFYKKQWSQIVDLLGRLHNARVKLPFVAFKMGLRAYAETGCDKLALELFERDKSRFQYGFEEIGIALEAAMRERRDDLVVSMCRDFHLLKEAYSVEVMTTIQDAWNKFPVFRHEMEKQKVIEFYHGRCYYRNLSEKSTIPLFLKCT